jgi:hypothetical protein
MSELKATPGPWHADEDGEFPIDIRSSAGPVVARVVAFPGGESDAHLIAAAPDMAAAIQLFIDALEGRDVHPEEAIGACRAALARAKGEQP